MNMTISSGFAIVSNDNKVLLGKADKYKDKGNWTVFKGSQENKESLIETAVRELNEEAGIDILVDDRLNKNHSSMPFHVYGIKEKIVYIYLLIDKEDALKDFKFQCKSYTPQGEPEIQEFKWYTLDEADKAIYCSQKGLIDKLRVLLA